MGTIFRFKRMIALLLFLALALLLALLLIALILALTTVLPTAHAQGNVIYVKHDATGNNDGTSWGDAYTTPQAALDAAGPDDEIWVARGVYTPTSRTTPSDPRTATFQLKSGVALYGGFAGTESQRDERDWIANVTVLSGDLEGNDTTDANGVVLTAGDIVGGNAYHIVTSSGVTETAVLDGFVVAAGQALSSGWPHYYGGGVYNYYGSPALANVILSGNQAQFGGGMFNYSSGPTLTNVAFSGNQAYCLGGGMSNGPSSSPTLVNVTFSGNQAGYYCSNGGGGGMYNYQSSPVLVNCILWGNAGPNKPEIYNNDGTPTIRYSLVQGSGGSGSGWDAALGIDGGHNLDANPLFVAPVSAGEAPTTAGNYRLRYGSPAIDAGDSSAAAVPTDLDGNPRIAGDAVDMGAYEAQLFLVVTLDGTGSGTVTSVPAGIDCPAGLCAKDFVTGTVVTLTAAVDTGSIFGGWGGACSGSIPTCQVTIDAPKSVTAAFVTYRTYLPLVVRNYGP